MSDIKKTSMSKDTHAVPRREKRHPVPEVYRHYMDLKVQSSEGFQRVLLYNFSRSGIQFESSVSFPVDSQADCVISMVRSLSKKVSFTIRVKYCLEKEDYFIVGAAIEEVADATWFDIFMEVHDFIVSRQGTVY